MNAYELRDLRVERAGRTVLRAERMDLPAGEVAALVGPNGAGKSSLLEALAFLLSARGTVRFFGGAPPPGPDARLVGLLPQRPYLFDTSVEANVGWGLRARGVSRRERAERVRAALEEVGLCGFERRRARALSGGEAQRVALARLLVLEPRVLLLDEPFNHLDPASRERIEAVVEARVRQGVTVVMATHDAVQARRLGARVWRLEGGRIRPEEPMNVFRGRVDPAEPGRFVTGRVALAVTPLPPGTRWVELSPREVVLAREAFPTSARNRLRGRIARAEDRGGEVWVTLDCGVPLTAVVTRESWAALGLATGDEAVASFKATAVRPLGG